MPTPVSRYKIDNDELRQAALALQLGRGISDRIRSIEASSFIQRAEDWAEAQVDEFIGVPLSPIRAQGQILQDFDPANITRRNFPHDFVQAVIYRATGLLLHSEYFENSPNVSEAGKWALDEADRHIMSFRDKATVLVGAGRRRHPNPHMPPMIAPRFPKDEARFKQQ